MNSKSSWKIYNELIESFGNEFNVLLNVKKEELSNVLKNDMLIEKVKWERSNSKQQK